MPVAVLETRGLCKSFGTVTAVHDVSIRLDAGDTVALFGPNGAGKTTLLRLCATLLRPSRGTVRLFGATADGGHPEERRKVGFLSHQSFLYPDLTASENLQFYARMFAVADADRRVRELLDQVGLRPWANRPVRALSRGLEQRCALARALLHRPALLLLDEPFTGLDVDATAILRRVLADARREGSALVLSTHDIAEGMAQCRRAVILVRGSVVWDGEITAAERDRFEHIYMAAVHSSSPPAAA
jgi:heme exporter protein A